MHARRLDPQCKPPSLPCVLNARPFFAITYARSITITWRGFVWLETGRSAGDLSGSLFTPAWRGKGCEEIEHSGSATPLAVSFSSPPDLTGCTSGDVSIPPRIFLIRQRATMEQAAPRSAMSGVPSLAVREEKLKASAPAVRPVFGLCRATSWSSGTTPCQLSSSTLSMPPLHFYSSSKACQTHRAPLRPRPPAQTSFRTQAGALFRKNAAQQRKSVCANVMVLLTPVFFCVLLFVLQRLINSATDTASNKVRRGPVSSGAQPTPAAAGGSVLRAAACCGRVVSLEGGVVLVVVVVS